MKIIRKIKPEITAEKPKKRVAAYARVSVATERLMHSISAQVSYYSELIQNNPEWEYAGVYADNGISGLSIAGRAEFSRMLADCDAGKIDLILCKSISRFARNTVDLLNTIRHLKEIGVEVRFEKENISSMSGDGEFMLTILASFAEEESRNISENVKWGLRKRMQSGEIGTANKHILGYQYDEEKHQYVIIPEEAEFVRWMFQMYLDGVSLRLIAENMNNAGIRSVLGNEFSEGTVRRLIFNEIYAGDLLRQKSFMENPVTKHKVPNHGEFPQYLISDCHEAILDRETYAKVQTEIKRRESLLNPVYCFTGKIHCAVCGNHFTRKKQKLRGNTYIHWICRSKKEKGMTCTSVNFRETDLINICTDMIGEDFENQILEMTVAESGDIQIRLIGGEVRSWTHLPKPVRIPKPKTKSERPAHIFDGKIFCGTCGRRFGRAVNRTTGHLLWRCRSKCTSGQTCDSVNYSDDEIKFAFCKTFECDVFDTEFFNAVISKIIIQKTGSIDFHTIDGTVRHFENFKLRINHHESTLTEEFAGKIVCAKCGNIYHKYVIREKYLYWYCSEKGKITTECRNADFSDCNLRRITAYIMQTDEFDGSTFLQEIDYISVNSDGSLEYHFKDGRIKKWQRM